MAVQRVADRTRPAGPPSYARSFGLREAPFSLVADRRFVFLGACHTKALAYLLHGVELGDAVLHLTGDIGSGKTTVCRLLLDRLPHDVDAALIPDPTLFSEAFDRTLRAAHSHRRRTVLIVDDAHRLGIDALEPLRLPHELLRVVLIGRSELIELLGLEVLPRLTRSTAAGYHLLPFAPAETSAYVRHRLALAGGAWDIFEGDALPEVHRLSGGTPRLINTICDRALLDAHARRRRTVDAPAVRAAAHKELPEGIAAEAPQSSTTARARRPPWWRLALGALVVTALVVGAVLIATRFSDQVIITPRGPAEREGYAAPSPSAGPPPPFQARPSKPEAGIAPEPTVPPESVPPPRPAQEKPALRIDILVWAPDAKDRQVYVNGRKYVEGDTMENGAVIEQIGLDGVVVVHRDQRTLIRYESRRPSPAEETAPR
jgi:general secretion pathway protein A